MMYLPRKKGVQFPLLLPTTDDDNLTFGRTLIAMDQVFGMYVRRVTLKAERRLSMVIFSPLHFRWLLSAQKLRLENRRC